MRKETQRKMVLIGISCLVIGSLAGCKKDVDINVGKAVDKEHIYETKEITLSKDSELTSYRVVDGQYYAIDYTDGALLVSIDHDGNVSNEVALELGNIDDSKVITYTKDENGNIWYVRGSDEKYELVESDENGTVLNATDITSLDKDGNFTDIECDSNGNLYLDSLLCAYVLDTEGEVQFKVKNSGYMIDLVKAPNGVIYQNVYNEDAEDCNLQPFNLEQQNLGEEIIFKCGDKSISGPCAYYLGNDYDLYVDNGSALYGCTLEGAVAEKLLNWVASDIEEGELTELYAESKDDIFAILGEDEDGKYYEFTKVDVANVADKEVITLSTTAVDTDLKNAIIAFNKQNQNYKIEITDYSQSVTEGDESAAVDKMNNEMVAGNVGDIIVMNLNTPYESYVSKGILADLNEFIEKDSSFNKVDYLQNMIEASEINGKLYNIIPSFYVQTLVGKEKYLGKTNGWTIDELNDLFASGKLPEEMAFFPDILTQQDMLQYMYMASQNEFLDNANAKGDFNNDTFKKILEFCKKCPKTVEKNVEFDEAFYSDYCKSYMEDRTLLDSLTLTDFWSYHEEVQTFFNGENITMVGFPSDDKNGQIIYAATELGISEKSENKDVAWEFIKFYLSEDFQKTINNAWPININALQDKAQKAMERGNSEDSIVEFNGENVNIGSMTQEEVDTVMDYLKSQNKILRSNTSVINIIQEEAKAYFNDEKTVEDTMELIQNRVQTYVSENK